MINAALIIGFGDDTGVAKKQNLLERSVKAGLIAIWETGENISDQKVYKTLMTKAGLDAEALLAAT